MKTNQINSIQNKKRLLGAENVGRPLRIFRQCPDAEAGGNVPNSENIEAKVGKHF